MAVPRMAGGTADASALAMVLAGGQRQATG
jgi:hypothetical protein